MQLDSVGANDSWVIELLMTPPPEVSACEASEAARYYFDEQVRCVRMAGERDCNFLVHSSVGKSTLKFINPAETPEETEMQIAVLRHLKDWGEVPVPRHIQPMHGQDTVLIAMANHTATKVRAYSYLEGEHGSGAKSTPTLRKDIGRAVAKLNLALQDFEHPAAHRVFLWDTMQIGRLGRFVDAVSNPVLRNFINEFLDVFTGTLLPRLKKLRHQVIHNDLSGSNFLVNSKAQQIIGILDFGDMVYAPLIADLAVAASYQMSGVNDPFMAFKEVTEAFESVNRLTEEERPLVLDLVMARLVQRVVITEWRAAHFPANRDYILRSHSAAAQLMTQIMNHWREDLELRLVNKCGV